MNKKNSKIAEHHHGPFQVIEIHEIEVRLVFCVFCLFVFPQPHKTTWEQFKAGCTQLIPLSP